MTIFYHPDGNDRIMMNKIFPLSPFSKIQKPILPSVFHILYDRDMVGVEVDTRRSVHHFSGDELMKVVLKLERGTTTG